MTQELFRQAVDQFSDHRWRLSNLYYITDEDGRRVKFQFREEQEQFFREMHYLNLILKARQLGFTTFIQIFMLDAAVFNSNIRCGTIAHTLGDAQTIFRDKVKFPYDSLPDGIKAAVPALNDSKTELLLGNNSSIRVGASLRSGTLQYLHVSEYGKLCAHYAEKAREVRTGALNTAQAGQLVFIESTAEGQEGHYYELCQSAQSKQRAKLPLGLLDFKFHFFPWWKTKKYELDPRGVAIPDAHERYFEKLERTAGIKLSDRKKAWYVKKAETQLSDMKREYPSTPEEAFEAAIEGAYYSDPLAQAELQGRIGEFAADPALPVHTAWDIGHSDYTSIWFWQRQVKKVRIVGFFQNTGEGMPYYVEECHKLYAERNWRREGAIDYVPHDARVTEWGSSKSRIEQMFAKGLNPRIPVELSLNDGINAVRAVLPYCQFDEGPSSEGLKMLRSYRKEWDEHGGLWKDTPRHDFSSHGADAFRYLACAYRELQPPAEDKPKVVLRGIGQMTVDELVKTLQPAKIRV